MKRLVSWNVNGVRAIVQKDFDSQIAALAPDILCLQETKAQDDQVAEALSGIASLSGYHQMAASAEKKGYSGTAVLSKTAPLSVTRGIGVPALDNEGRVICAEFEDVHVVTVYTPNSSSGLKRLPFRKEWDVAFTQYIQALDAAKPVIVCGDLNVAHAPIDLARPDANYNKTPGYTQEEIDGMSRLLAEAHLTDAWRAQHPDEVRYSWWSYRGGAREKNVGWRLDYTLVSERLMGRVSATDIRTDLTGSDHCPVVIEWE